VLLGLDSALAEAQRQQAPQAARGSALAAQPLLTAAPSPAGTHYAAASSSSSSQTRAPAQRARGLITNVGAAAPPPPFTPLALGSVVASLSGLSKHMPGRGGVHKSDGALWVSLCIYVCVFVRVCVYLCVCVCVCV
jgi:hypothetical protein